MINIRTIKKMLDGDTLNLKNGNVKKYKGGFNVNVETFSAETPEDAIKLVRAVSGISKGCNIQFKNGKYYISSCAHTYTRTQAKALAESLRQNAIYEWQNLAHQAV